MHNSEQNLLHLWSPLGSGLGSGLSGHKVPKPLTMSGVLGLGVMDNISGSCMLLLAITTLRAR